MANNLLHLDALLQASISANAQFANASNDALIASRDSDIPDARSLDHVLTDTTATVPKRREHDFSGRARQDKSSSASKRKTPIPVNGESSVLQPHLSGQYDIDDARNEESTGATSAHHLAFDTSQQGRHVQVKNMTKYMVMVKALYEYIFSSSDPDNTQLVPPFSIKPFTIHQKQAMLLRERDVNEVGLREMLIFLTDIITCDGDRNARYVLIHKNVLNIYCCLCEDGYSEFATSVFIEHLQTSKYSTDSPKISNSIRLCYQILLASQKFFRNRSNTSESFIKVLSHILSSYVWDFKPEHDTMKFFFKSVALVMNDQYRDAIPGEDPIVAKTRRRHRTILFSDIAKKIFRRPDLYSFFGWSQYKDNVSGPWLPCECWEVLVEVLEHTIHLPANSKGDNISGYYFLLVLKILQNIRDNHPLESRMELKPVPTTRLIYVVYMHRGIDDGWNKLNLPQLFHEHSLKNYSWNSQWGMRLAFFCVFEIVRNGGAVNFNTDFRTRIIQFLAMTFNKQVCSVKDMAILKVCEDGYEMRHRFLVFLVQHSNVLLPWILQQHELSPNAIRRLLKNWIMMYRFVVLDESYQTYWYELQSLLRDCDKSYEIPVFEMILDILLSDNEFHEPEHFAATNIFLSSIECCFDIEAISKNECKKLLEFLLHIWHHIDQRRVRSDAMLDTSFYMPYITETFQLLFHYLKHARVVDLKRFANELIQMMNIDMFNDLIVSFGPKLKERLQQDVSKCSVVHEQYLEVYLDYLYILHKIYTIFAWANHSFARKLSSMPNFVDHLKLNIRTLQVSARYLQHAAKSAPDIVDRLYQLRNIEVQLFATIIAVNHKDGQTKYDAFYYDLMHSLLSSSVTQPWMPGVAAYPNHPLTSHYDAVPLCILMAHIPVEALRKQHEATIYYLHSIMDFILAMEQEQNVELKWYLIELMCDSIEHVLKNESAAPREDLINDRRIASFARKISKWSFCAEKPQTRDFERVMFKFVNLFLKYKPTWRHNVFSPEAAIADGSAHPYAIYEYIGHCMTIKDGVSAKLAREFISYFDDNMLIRIVQEWANIECERKGMLGSSSEDVPARLFREIPVYERVQEGQSQIWTARMPYLAKAWINFGEDLGDVGVQTRAHKRYRTVKTGDVL